jgi:hypothetical protein
MSVASVASARKRLLDEYRRTGSYHEVAESHGVNVRYVHDFLMKGRVPPNSDVQRALGIDTGRPSASARLVEVVYDALKGRLGEGNTLRRSELLECIHQLPDFRNVDDRRIRAAVEVLREAGNLICTSLDGEGYHIASSMEEYQRFLPQYTSYASTIYRRVRAMNLEAEKRFGASVAQERMPGL